MSNSRTLVETDTAVARELLRVALGSQNHGDNNTSNGGSIGVRLSNPQPEPHTGNYTVCVALTRRHLRRRYHVYKERQHQQQQRQSRGDTVHNNNAISSATADPVSPPAPVSFWQSGACLPQTSAAAAATRAGGGGRQHQQQHRSRDKKSHSHSHSHGGGGGGGAYHDGDGHSDGRRALVVSSDPSRDAEEVVVVSHLTATFTPDYPRVPCAWAWCSAPPPAAPPSTVAGAAAAAAATIQADGTLRFPVSVFPSPPVTSSNANATIIASTSNNSNNNNNNSSNIGNTAAPTHAEENGNAHEGEGDAKTAGDDAGGKRKRKRKEAAEGTSGHSAGPTYHGKRSKDSHGGYAATEVAEEGEERQRQKRQQQQRVADTDAAAEAEAEAEAALQVEASGERAVREELVRGTLLAWLRRHQQRRRQAAGEGEEGEEEAAAAAEPSEAVKGFSHAGDAADSGAVMSPFLQDLAVLLRGWASIEMDAGGGDGGDERGEAAPMNAGLTGVATTSVTTTTSNTTGVSAVPTADLVVSASGATTGTAAAAADGTAGFASVTGEGSKNNMNSTVYNTSGGSSESHTALLSGTKSKNNASTSGSASISGSGGGGGGVGAVAAAVSAVSAGGASVVATTAAATGVLVSSSPGGGGAEAVGSVGGAYVGRRPQFRALLLPGGEVTLPNGVLSHSHASDHRYAASTASGATATTTATAATSGGCPLLCVGVPSLLLPGVALAGSGPAPLVNSNNNSNNNNNSNSNNALAAERRRRVRLAREQCEWSDIVLCVADGAGDGGAGGVSVAAAAAADADAAARAGVVPPLANVYAGAGAALRHNAGVCRALGLPALASVLLSLRRLARGAGAPAYTRDLLCPAVCRAVQLLQHERRPLWAGVLVCCLLLPPLLRGGGGGGGDTAPGGAAELQAWRGRPELLAVVAHLERVLALGGAVVLACEARRVRLALSPAAATVAGGTPARLIACCAAAAAAAANGTYASHSYPCAGAASCGGGGGPAAALGTTASGQMCVGRPHAPATECAVCGLPLVRRRRQAHRLRKQSRHGRQQQQQQQQQQRPSSPPSFSCQRGREAQPAGEGCLLLQCRLCGHGGHVDHLTRWWGTEGVARCPTGCGCECVY